MAGLIGLGSGGSGSGKSDADNVGLEKGEDNRPGIIRRTWNALTGQNEGTSEA